MNMRQAVLAVYAFRHFNRVSSWKYLRRCFRAGRAEPDWTILEKDLRNADEGLFKAFARPVTVYDTEGDYLGDDCIENALLTFKGVWEHEALDTIASLLTSTIETPSQYEDFTRAWDALQNSFPGAVGTYRRKTNYDIWVAGRYVTPRAMSSYPVAAPSGTADSLRKLYGVTTKSEKVLSKLLVHLFHRCSPTREDSLATLSLNLCGWHRSLKRCSYDGRTMSLLSRAIAQEEKEFLADKI